MLSHSGQRYKIDFRERAVRSLTLCRLKVYILKNYYMELTLELIERVKECLEYIRPQLQADGGDVEFVELQDGGKVVVKLTGACGSCPMATMTLKHGVEQLLKDKIPEVTEVVQAF